MAALLAKAGPSLSVKTLLDNLQITSEFESTMAKKWATPVGVFFCEFEFAVTDKKFRPQVPDHFERYSWHPRSTIQIHLVFVRSTYEYLCQRSRQVRRSYRFNIISDANSFQGIS